MKRYIKKILDRLSRVAVLNEVNEKLDRLDANILDLKIESGKFLKYSPIRLNAGISSLAKTAFPFTLVFKITYLIST